MHLSGAEKCTPKVQKNAPPSYIENKEENKQQQGEVVVVFRDAEEKAKLFEEHEISKSVAKEFDSLPLEQIKIAISAAQDYAEKNDVASLSGLICKAIRERWKAPKASKKKPDKKPQDSNNQYDKEKKACIKIIENYKIYIPEKANIYFKDDRICIQIDSALQEFGLFFPGLLERLEIFLQRTFKSGSPK